ncbi:MAG: hypothetical protein JOZ27_03515 [Caulobacteraceae bacterium]|nr:hypothetical protein [Caulobacteraceae bacterium]
MRRLGDRSIRETDLRWDNVVGVATMTLLPANAGMISTYEDKPVGKTYRMRASRMSPLEGPARSLWSAHARHLAE